MLESVLKRLEEHTEDMPLGIEMIATTLGWHVPSAQFAITERTITSEEPNLPQTLPIPASMQHHIEGNFSHVLQEHVYLDKALALSQKMGRMNAPGFFNYFGSITVKNSVKVLMVIADIFKEEVDKINKTAGLQVYIVYNPLTIPTIEKMRRRGGNALGLHPGDGPLISKS